MSKNLLRHQWYVEVAKDALVSKLTERLKVLGVEWKCLAEQCERAAAQCVRLRAALGEEVLDADGA